MLNNVRLINDLEANALGISTLKPEQLFCLNPGQPRADGNRALIAAGAGLGMALLVRASDGYHVAASEGGHADFAPRNEEEVALWRSLAARFGRVSVERVVYAMSVGWMACSTCVLRPGCQLGAWRSSRHCCSRPSSAS